jgi:hypothetical protein
MLKMLAATVGKTILPRQGQNFAVAVAAVLRGQQG